jgi:uncharacterized surface protein with fasciclin (FAS1) repeats
MNTKKIKLVKLFSNFKSINKLWGLFFSLAISIILLLPGCIDDEDTGAYYTAVEETAGEYITSHQEYSEFAKMLEKCGVMGLLNAYGKYTCFVPNNKAMYDFYKAKGKNSVDDFQVDSIRKIVYDHIIKDDTVTSADFVAGFIPYLTMSGRYIKISFETGTGKLVYKLNSTATIVTTDIIVHNGIIHVLDEALMPTANNLFEAISGDSKFKLFTEALIATGLYKQILPIKDESFIPSDDYYEYNGKINSAPIGGAIGGMTRLPKERKYGFTALMESDSIYQLNGIMNLDDLKAYAKDVYDKMYPEDKDVSDITDNRNSLNRFVAYHLINKKISAKFFIEKFDNTGQEYATKGQTHSVKTVDMSEYIETMCPNTLLEVRTLRSTNEYNIFNMIEETGEAIRLTSDFDNDAVNGVYHEIDHILAYSTAVDRMLSSKRIRMDAASFFHELANNDIRVGHASTNYLNEFWIFPQGYFDRVTTTKNTTFAYFNSDDRFLDYQGDEVFLVGMYDFEIITPPIPAGTYEVRFGYQPTPNRGAAQLYWDGVPTGIPLDLRPDAKDPKIGYVKPGDDEEDPDGFENDKMMRNRGYMKAPACFQVVDDADNGGWYSGPVARNSQSAVRRILGIYTFDKASTHVFKVKAVRSGQFMFDYLEFVPMEVLEKEDIY